MKASKKILVPVDGSGNSIRALEYAAARITAGDDRALLIVNVQPGMLPSRFVSRATIEEYRQRNSRAALEPARAILRRYKLDADVQVRIGDPAGTIVNLAKQKRCAEIIMGSRGRGRVPSLLLGSVASKVVQLSPCPVTIVK